MVRFLTSFVFCFLCLMALVFLGTGFDKVMSFSWYAYLICGILSLVYAGVQLLNHQKVELTPEDGKKHQSKTV